MENRGTLDTLGLMQYLKIGRNSAQKLMRSKDFPAIQISPRRRVVPVTELEAWLRRQAIDNQHH
jgi:hypothetical protein